MKAEGYSDKEIALCLAVRDNLKYRDSKQKKQKAAASSQGAEASRPRPATEYPVSHLRSDFGLSLLQLHCVDHVVNVVVLARRR